MFINMFNDSLQFSEDPFKITPDPKFFYPTISHGKTLASKIGVLMIGKDRNARF